MSAPPQAHPSFDTDRYVRAVESADAEAMVAQYSDDARMEMIDRRTPPSAPTVLRGREEIGRALRDVCSREMTHEVLQCVSDGEHVAVTERCTYPGGGKVMSMAMLDLRDGRIVHESVVQAWDEGSADTPQGARFDGAEQSQEFERGRMEVVSVGGRAVTRLTLMPGWRWSEHLRPLQGTDSCMRTHCGYMVSGALACRMDDGTEREFGRGDVVFIPPGHDGWVVGGETAVMIDWCAAESG